MNLTKSLSSLSQQLLVMSDQQQAADAALREAMKGLPECEESESYAGAVACIARLQKELAATREARDTLSALSGIETDETQSPTLKGIQAAAVAVHCLPRGTRRGDPLNLARYLRTRGWGELGGMTWRDPMSSTAFVQESALDIQLRRDLDPFKSLLEGLGRRPEFFANEPVLSI